MLEMKTREEMVDELIKIKIPTGLINHIAKKERSVLGSGMMNSLNKMNDQAIRSLYSAIIDAMLLIFSDLRILFFCDES